MALTIQRHLLLLAGTTEAREIAAQIARDPDLKRRYRVTAALAGATESPAPLNADQLRGRFGGAEGMMTALKWDRIDLVVDATHPYATTISENARLACGALGTPLLQVWRPAWAPGPSDDWRATPDLESAAAALPFFCRAFLATGRRSLAAFKERRDVWFLARVIDPPGARFPLPRGDYAVGRPPFTVAHEETLLTDYRIGWLVSKNAGGEAGWTKLLAARKLGLPVLMIDRPPAPRPTPGGAVVETSAAAIDWLRQRR